MKYDGFSFYSPELVHVEEGKLTDLVDGLNECKQFKPLTHSQSGSYIMLACIRDMKKIEAHNIQHSYTGNDGWGDCILVQVSLNENASSLQMQCTDLKNRGLLLRKFDGYYSSILELGKDKIMVNDLIVD